MAVRAPTLRMTRGELFQVKPELFLLIIAQYPFLTAADIDKLLELYPNDPALGVPYGRLDGAVFPELGLQWRRTASISGDILMIAPTRWTAQTLSRSVPPVYKYRFNVTNPLLGLPEPFGAAHAVEIGYVWSTPPLRVTPEMARVVDVMSRSWLSFFVHLDPNYHGLTGVPQWPKYSEEGTEFHVKIDSIEVEPDDYRYEGIKFINSVKERNI